MQEEIRLQACSRQQEEIDEIALIERAKGSKKGYKKKERLEQGKMLQVSSDGSLCHPMLGEEKECHASKWRDSYTLT